MVNLLSKSRWRILESLISQNLGDVFPALSLSVIKQQQLILDDAWGWIDPETRQIPVQTNTLFDLASVTKLFTSTAFLSLVSEGKVALDTPIIEVIPEFGTISPRTIDGGQDPHSKARLPVPDAFIGQTVQPEKVTFFHLLTHTSGLPPWRDVFNVVIPPTPPNQVDTIGRDVRWRQAIERLTTYPFVAQIDGIVRYSDIGLMLLGEAASRLDEVSGKLDVVIARRVLAPIGLTDVYFNPVREHAISIERIAPTENDPTWRERRAWGEVHDENACGVGGVAGHAGLFAQASDIAKFGETWLYHPDVFEIDQFLADKARREQAHTDDERRGLGWMLKSPENSSAGALFHIDSYGHTGFTGTSLWIDPTRELIVACMTNRVYPGRERPGIHAFRRAIHDFFVEATEDL